MHMYMHYCFLCPRHTKREKDPTGAQPALTYRRASVGLPTASQPEGRVKPKHAKLYCPPESPALTYLQLPKPSFLVGKLQILYRALKQEPTTIMVLVVNGLLLFYID